MLLYREYSEDWGLYPTLGYSDVFFHILLFIFLLFSSIPVGRRGVLDTCVYVWYICWSKLRTASVAKHCCARIGGLCVGHSLADIVIQRR